MKKITSYAAAILLTLFIISSHGCTKKKEDTQTTECKTCKAFAAEGKPEVTQDVCSDTEEQNFRSQHSSQEISCH